MIKKRFGFTLAEVMIGVFIASVLGFAIMKFMSNAQATAAIARCRSQLRQNAQLVARQLEKDIASSRVKYNEKASEGKRYTITLKVGSPTSSPIAEIEVPKENAELDDKKFFSGKETDTDDLYDKISYSIDEKGVLTRGGSRLATNIKSIDIPKTKNGIDISYDGKIDITITTVGKPDGSPKEIEHKEQLLVTIRGLQGKLNEKENPHWKQRVNASNY